MSERLYFLSKDNMDGKTLSPRIPENYFTKNGFEDNKTKRVCFAPSIDKALLALSTNINNMELYVHVPEREIESKYIIKPTISQVPDSKITHEIWVTKSVDLKCIGKIKIIGTYDTVYKYEYGKNEGHMYKWKWKWLEKAVNEKALTSSDNKMYRVIYDDEGIYEALRKNVTMEQWHEILRSRDINWLPKPKSYPRGSQSYFTKEGYDIFKKRTLPIILKYLDKKLIKHQSYNILPNPAYQDKYQIIYYNTINEKALTSKQRKNLDDDIFGVPELRKYPLNDKDHVLQAMRFFSKCEDKHKKELARNILKRAEELGMGVNHASEYYKLVKEAGENILNESYVFDDKDLYINFNQWKREKGKNILFVTGLSGSGKTTLGEQLERKHKAFLFEIDGLEHRYDSSNKGIIKKVCDEYPEYDKYFSDGKNNIPKGLYYKILHKALDKVIKIMSEDCNNLYIIEGVQIFQWLSASKVRSRPIVIKGTSMLNSIVRRFKRNGNGKIDWTKELQNEFPQLVDWYIEDTDKFTKFKKELVKEDTIIQEGLFNPSDYIFTREDLYYNISKFAYGDMYDLDMVDPASEEGRGSLFIIRRPPDNFIKESYIEEASEDLYKYSSDFKDIQSVIDSLPKKDLLHICNGTFKNSPYVIYRKAYKNGNSTLGFLELYELPNNKESAFLVFAIDPKFRGNGLTNDMIRDAINYAYKDKNIKKIIWRADKDNDISNYLAKKFHFTPIENKSKTKNEYELLLDQGGGQSYTPDKNDIYIHFDRWAEDKSLVLLVTGLSGGGKSTLALSLADKYDADLVQLDGLEGNFDFSDNHFLNKFKKAHPEYDSNFKNKWDGNRDNIPFREYIRFCINVAQKNNIKLIIEGIQIYQLISESSKDISFIKGKPIIIKSTSVLTSKFRQIKRLLSGGGKGHTLIELIQNDKQLRSFKKEIMRESYIEESTVEKKYKCPFCDTKDTKANLVTHVLDDHEDMIPHGYTAARTVYNYINKTDGGHCIYCKGETEWCEDRWKYKRICTKAVCKKKASEQADINMKKKYGKTAQEMLNDPNHQNKMLAGRSISGEYNFKGQKKSYVGTYELKLLKFYDKVLNVGPEEIQTPGPVIEYEFNGKKHQWITDLYYVTANLVHDAKDGGDNPNTRDMKEYRAKQTAKENAIIKQNKYNYIRLTNNEFEQLLEILAELKQQMMDDDIEEKMIYKINEYMCIGSINPVIGSGACIVNYGVNGQYAGQAFTKDKFMSSIYMVDPTTSKVEKRTAKDIMDNYDFELYAHNDNKDSKNIITQIESAIEEGKEVNHDFFYELLTGNRLLDESQLSNDIRFTKVLDAYSYMNEVCESIKETIRDEYKQCIGENILSLESAHNNPNSIFRVMEDTNGYYVQNTINNHRSRYYDNISEIPSELNAILK